MAQQYDAPVQDVAESVGAAFGTSLKSAVQSLLSPLGTTAKAQKIETASEIATSDADVLFFDANFDNSQTLNIDDSGRTNGRVFVFEGDQGFSAIFNTVERVIIGSAGGDNFTVAGDKNTTVEGGVGNDTLTSSGGNDSITGGVGDDSITAGAGNDTVLGGAGSDTIVGGAGADTLHGGEGDDTVSFSGNRSDFTVTTDNGVVTVTSNSNSQDVSTLVNVEQLQFDDGTETVEYGDDLAVIATLYQQILGRQADLAGFQFYADSVDSGRTFGSIAIDFINSAENALALGLALNPEAYANQGIDVLYQELLGRDSDAAGKAFWVDRVLNGGQSLDEVAQAFTESNELQGLLLNPNGWDFLL